jgi:putative FmdB family regulatory protein
MGLSCDTVQGKMPIFEYQCRQCSKQFELLVMKWTKVECPSCQSQDLEQLLSTFGMSSDGIRQANAISSRRAQASSSEFKEKNIAHQEYVKKHADD